MAKIQEALKSTIRSVLPVKTVAADLLKTLAEREQELANIRTGRICAIETAPSSRADRQGEGAGPTQGEAQETRVRRPAESMLRELAIAAANDHGKFTQMISSTSISTELPLALSRHLETALRVMNKNLDRSDTLHDLITFTREAQRLTPEGIDMAHLIRKQRNIVAHSKADPHTVPARAVLCLFAAAILWPEFPDN